MQGGGDRSAPAPPAARAGRRRRGPAAVAPRTSIVRRRISTGISAPPAPRTRVSQGAPSEASSARRSSGQSDAGTRLRSRRFAQGRHRLAEQRLGGRVGVENGAVRARAGWPRTSRRRRPPAAPPPHEPAAARSRRRGAPPPFWSVSIRRLEQVGKPLRVVAGDDGQAGGEVDIAAHEGPAWRPPRARLPSRVGVLGDVEARLLVDGATRTAMTRDRHANASTLEAQPEGPKRRSRRRRAPARPVAPRDRPPAARRRERRAHSASVAEGARRTVHADGAHRVVDLPSRVSISRLASLATTPPRKPTSSRPAGRDFEQVRPGGISRGATRRHPTPPRL